MPKRYSLLCTLAPHLTRKKAPKGKRRSQISKPTQLAYELFCCKLVAATGKQSAVSSRGFLPEILRNELLEINAIRAQRMLTAHWILSLNSTTKQCMRQITRFEGPVACLEPRRANYSTLQLSATFVKFSTRKDHCFSFSRLGHSKHGQCHSSRKRQRL